MIANTAVTKITDTLTFEDSQKLTVKKFQKMDPKTRAELLERCPVQPMSSRHIVSLNEEPVSFDAFQSHTPGIISTKGAYAIRYNAASAQVRQKLRAFCIYTDLLSFHKLDVSGPIHLRAIAKRIPEVAWMLRNSTFSFELFGLAKMHPGVSFDFTIDWVNYARMITAKAEAQGLDIDHKPYVCFKCSEKDFDEKYNKKVLAEKPDKSYYEKAIKEAEQEAKEQGEI